jgi:ABC-2 type transport system ATP-binding protein/heme exporter protein A
MSKAVQIQGVTKNYGLLPALHSIDLDVSLGESVAFLGPNGAGKSTLLKIVAGQISPSSGIVQVMGCDVQKSPEEVKSLVGLVGHRSFMYNELTVEENLRFYGKFFSASQADFERVIEMTDMERWRNTKARHLSFGLSKRADIARALLGNPRVLVLDELFSGLDVDASELLVKHLKSNREASILISSHSLDWAKRLCGRGVFLRNGRIERDVEF